MSGSGSDNMTRTPVARALLTISAPMSVGILGVLLVGLADAFFLARVGSVELAAIGFVLEAERERELSQDRQRITIREDDDQGVWTAIGKMRTLSTRL